MKVPWQKERSTGGETAVQLRSGGRSTFGRLESYVPLLDGETALYRAVREAVPVDIARVTDRAHISRVLCNGKLAGTLYARHLQPIMGIPALVLPSTSPANAIWTLPKLTDAWRKALTDENATFCE